MTRPRFTTAALFLSLFAPLTLPAQEKEKVDKSRFVKIATAAWEEQDWAKASAALSKLVEVDADDPEAWYRLGYALHAQQKLDEALKAHLRAASFTSSRFARVATYNAACVYALKNDKDKAFEWLNKAVDAGFSNVDQFESDSDMDNLRADPRFKKVLERARKAGYAAPVQVFNYPSTRMSTRATYFAGNSSPGQLAIDYGAPKWSDKYAGVLDDPKYVNRRWRFGANFWTTLDTNVPLVISGQEIPAGNYYLTVTHKGDRKFAMNVIDPTTVRKYRIDPFVAHLTKGGTDVELKYEKLDEIAELLSIEIKIDKQKVAQGTLVVRFGPHKLTAPMKIPLAR